jgi:hypothetical protein
MTGMKQLSVTEIHDSHRQSDDHVTEWYRLFGSQRPPEQIISQEDFLQFTEEAVLDIFPRSLHGTQELEGTSDESRIQIATNGARQSANDYCRQFPDAQPCFPPVLFKSQRTQARLLRQQRKRRQDLDDDNDYGTDVEEQAARQQRRSECMDNMQSMFHANVSGEQSWIIPLLALMNGAESVRRSLTANAHTLTSRALYDLGVGLSAALRNGSGLQRLRMATDAAWTLVEHINAERERRARTNDTPEVNHCFMSLLHYIEGSVNPHGASAARDLASRVLHREADTYLSLIDIERQRIGTCAAQSLPFLEQFRAVLEEVETCDMCEQSERTICETYTYPIHFPARRRAAHNGFPDWHNQNCESKNCSKCPMYSSKRRTFVKAPAVLLCEPKRLVGGQRSAQKIDVLSRMRITPKLPSHAHEVVADEGSYSLCGVVFSGNATVHVEETLQEQAVQPRAETRRFAFQRGRTYPTVVSQPQTEPEQRPQPQTQPPRARPMPAFATLTRSFINDKW